MHNTFQGKPSSGMLKIERLESQIRQRSPLPEGGELRSPMSEGGEL